MAILPENLSHNYINPAYATPNQIASLREYAKFLMEGKGQQDVKHWSQGASNMISALMGGIDAGRSDRMERDAMRGSIDQQTPLIASLLSAGQGGQPTPQASAPAPSIQSASLPPATPAAPNMPRPGGEIMPDKRVWGDKEAVDAGLYEPSVGQRVADASPANPSFATAGWPQASTGVASPSSPPVSAAAAPPAQPPAAVSSPAAGAAPTSGLGMNAAQVAALLQNPWVPKDTKDMVMGLVKPQVMNDAFGRPMLWRPGDPSGAHPIPGIPGGVFKEIKSGDTTMPALITPPNAPGGAPGMSIPGAGGVAPGGSPLGGMQPVIDATRANKVETERQTEIAKKGGEAIMSPIAEVMKEAKTAPQALNAVNIIEDVAKSYGDKITTGGLGEPVLKLKQAINGLAGTNVMGDTAPAELIKKMNAQLASAALPAFTNRGTQFDLKVFMENNPGLNNSIQGTLFLTGIMKQIYRQNLQLSQMAADKNNWNNWGQVQTDFYAKNPLVNPLTNKPLGVSADTPQQTGDATTGGNWTNIDGVKIRAR